MAHQQPYMRRLGYLCISAAACSPYLANAQTAQDGAPPTIEEVVIVGSQIKGANIEGALPVSVLTEEDIQLTGAATGDELLRSIPQMGAIGFNESVTTGVNAARGDVNSINLRGVGTGNTLVLLNGRRMVLHPGTQTENFIPVVTTNSNTLPVYGIERVEVLRDGAAALYGTDAVAGVVNYVLKHDYEGGQLGVRYGMGDGTDFRQATINGAKGFEFNEGQTNLTLMGTYYNKNGFSAKERDYSSNSDLRGFFEGDPLFEGDTSLDNRSGTFQGWGIYDYDGIGRQHLRPADLVRDNGSTYSAADCTSTTAANSLELSSDLCLDSGSGDRALRQNRNLTRELTPDAERVNFFAFLNHDFDSGMEYYAELGYYHAEVDRVREAAGILSNGRFEVPADYYWNPLGPVQFADGRINPNRIVPAGDADVPDEGLGFSLRSYVPYDIGFREVNVEDESFRFVNGLRGSFGDWDWDSGLVYSEAETVDSTDNRVSSTLFQQSLLLDTPDAYNVFTGIDVNDPSSPFDPTVNPSEVIDTFRINVRRASKTSLLLADFKLSNPAVFSLPAGDVGMATGVEWRKEDFDENRDQRSDGTIQFTDLVTDELLNVSDIMGSSASPDADGARRVTSAYIELLVPLLRDKPFVESLDMQLAARYESFSDVGDVTKPKVALSWYPVEWLQFRGAYAEGFRAPNLVQIHQEATTVVNTRSDPVTGNTVGLEERRLGNEDLEPEENETHSYGLVFTLIEDLVITLDYWRIEQEGVIGILGANNGLLLDQLLRDNGSSNPNVVREVTTDGSIGDPVVFFDRFLNLDPRTIEGADFSVLYGFENNLGQFDLKLNGAYLKTFDQDPSPELQLLDDAGVAAANSGSIIKENGRPRWRANASLQWRKAQWGAGLFVNYVGEVNDTSTRADNDTAAPGTLLPVDDFTTVNSYVDYRFEDGMAEDTRLRFGIRNMFDEEPPVADEQLGYFGSLHSNRGRNFYIDIAKNF